VNADHPVETELARGVMAGDAGAFDLFVKHFQNKVFQYSYLMCGHVEDAEEVAQETLFKVFESFDQLREPERVKPWVFRIARNMCLMKRRRSVFAPARELSLDELMPAASREGGERKLEIADWSALPDAAVLQSELRDAVAQAISELPDIYKAVVLLRDMEEMTTEEAAEILDVSIDVVKTRLHRGRLALRQKLDAWLRSARSVRA
jgi:RNA polymerase sigma-70 factor (ECF subfamily)